jgi:hypothetical protein
VSAITEPLCRSYSMHGVNVEVLADDPDVFPAMDLRLRSFVGNMNPAQPTLRFEFVSSAPTRPNPTGISRPVYETPHGSLHYFADEDVLAGSLGGVGLYCEPAEGRALITAPRFRATALYFATHPVATVALMEMMERRARFSLHAACVADADGNGLLLSGPSGAGKSTLTLALARAGLALLGDDTLFLDVSGVEVPGVRILGFPDALGLGMFAAVRFPELASVAAQVPADGFPKRLLRPEELFGREPLASCDPRVIVFPEVAPDLPSAVAAIDRGDALVRLAPDVLLTHTEATKAHVAAIGELLGQVRCYAVRSGYDLERAAELTRELI